MGCILNGRGKGFFQFLRKEGMRALLFREFYGKKECYNFFKGRDGL